MPHVIRLRDVKRAHTFELGPEEPVFRVPYDLFQPDGPARLRGMLAEWIEGGFAKTGRVVAAKLGETHPGERVLLQSSATTFSPVPRGEGPDDEWWLCEVETVGGEQSS